MIRGLTYRHQKKSQRLGLHISRLSAMLSAVSRSILLDFKIIEHLSMLRPVFVKNESITVFVQFSLLSKISKNVFLHRFLLYTYMYVSVNFKIPAVEVISIFLPANVVDVGLSREEGALIMSINGVMFAVSQLLVGVVADLLHVPISYILTLSLLVLTVTSVSIPFCQSLLSLILCSSTFAVFHGKSSETFDFLLIENSLNDEKVTSIFNKSLLFKLP